MKPGAASWVGVVARPRPERAQATAAAMAAATITHDRAGGTTSLRKWPKEIHLSLIHI